MPVEALVFVLTVVFLAVVAGLAINGMLGMLGVARIRSCPMCQRWTIGSADRATALCFRCRYGVHPHQLWHGHLLGGHHLHLPGHLLH